MAVLRDNILLLLVGIMFLGGCTLIPEKYRPGAQPAQVAGDQLLAKGIKSYENGEYGSAAKTINEALEAGFSQKRGSATAHKYLAFIACSSDNTRKCEDEFRMAFQDDPGFALTKAEEGHPVWGPIYRKVRDQIKSR